MCPSQPNRPTPALTHPRIRFLYVGRSSVPVLRAGGLSLSALPAVHHHQVGLVGAAQVGPTSAGVLEDVADSPRHRAVGVVVRALQPAVQGQLQDHGVAGQQDVVPAQRHHLVGGGDRRSDGRLDGEEGRPTFCVSVCVCVCVCV